MYKFFHKRKDNECEQNVVKFCPDFLILNCQALTNIKSDITSTDYHSLYNFSFLCFVETHGHRDNCIKFQGFKEISRFSRSHHKGGGVGIWAHESLSVSKLELIIALNSTLK
nr:unnamed protein product [Callosobruchus analis]